MYKLFNKLTRVVMILYFMFKSAWFFFIFSFAALTLSCGSLPFSQYLLWTSAIEMWWTLCRLSFTPCCCGVLAQSLQAKHRFWNVCSTGSLPAPQSYLQHLWLWFICVGRELEELPKEAKWRQSVKKITGVKAAPVYKKQSCMSKKVPSSIISTKKAFSDLRPEQQTDRINVFQNRWQSHVN